MVDYCFIVNPRAGQAAGRRARAFQAALARAGVAAAVRRTEGPGHAVSVAREAAREARAVVAVGGDGTVHEVVRGLVEAGTPVPLGVVPMGTGNDFVKMVGMPSEPGAAVAALLRARPRAVDYGLARWWEGGVASSTPFVNAVGTGFDATVADAAASYKFLPGVLGYLAAVLRVLGSWRSPEMRLRVETASGETEEMQRTVFLAIAGNGRSSGGGFYLTPDASVTDGAFDVCVVEGVGPGRVLRLLPSVFSGGHVHAPEVHLYRAVRLCVEMASPQPVHADGEILSRRAERLEAEIVPGGLPVLFPP